MSVNGSTGGPLAGSTRKGRGRRPGPDLRHGQPSRLDPDAARTLAVDLKAGIERSPVVVYRWRDDPGWPVTFVTANVEQFGYEAESFVGGALRLADVIHPDDLARVQDEVRIHWSEGRDEFARQYRIVTASGEARWIDDRTTVVRDADGGIRFIEGVLIDVTERKGGELALQRTTRALATLSAGNRAIVHADSVDELLRGFCHAVVHDGGYQLAWLGVAVDDPERSVRILASAGDDRGYLDGYRVSWSRHSPLGQGLVGRALRDGESLSTDDIPADAALEPWRRAAAAAGLRSAIVIPLPRIEPPMVLSIYGTEPGAFDGEARDLLETLADDFAFGLRARRIDHDRRVKEAALSEATERFRKIIDENADGIMVTDAQGRVLLVNPRGEEILGRAADEVIGSRTEFPGAGGDSFEFELVRPDGGYVSLEVRGVDLDWQGRPAQLLTLRDVSARKRIELELRRSEARFRFLYEDNPTAYFTLDVDGAIRSVNRFGASQLGYQVDEIRGTPFRALFAPEHRNVADRFVTDALSSPGKVHEVELPVRLRRGEIRWIRQFARAIDAPDGTEVLIVCEDVTETRTLSEELVYQARHDALTGLINRREFERQLEEATRTIRGDREHTLFYLDLDQFKIINDTCGHAAGDEVLRQVAGLLRQCVRQGDTLARLGGDEFGVLAWDCDAEGGRRIADGMARRIRGYPFSWRERTFRLAASIGIVTVSEASADVERLLIMADEACYAAKEMGRNRFHVYQESDAELVRRHREMEWVAHIHDALANDRFHLAWQPIVPVRAASRGRLQLEILVRMTDASGAIVAPGAFLPAAERFGVVGDIDRWVIHAVFDWLDRHRQVLERLNFVSINLSGRSLGSDEILTFLEQRVRSMPELFGRLCFEVTETATIANYEAATSFIGHLRRYGCRFALDDFGSGLSSFAYLRDLKVDFLKIDGAFVRDLTRDPVDESIVRYINEIGHVMGKQTIAEFVEDPQTLERLAEIGIDFAQGYAIAPPRPLDELVLAP